MKSKLLFTALSIISLAQIQPAAAQSPSEDMTAINMHNLFQKQCYDKFPFIEKIRDEARVGNWVVGPTHKGKPVSWAINEGLDNFSIMAIESPSNSSMTCEVRGKVSEVAAVSAFENIYASQIGAVRTSQYENAWTTPNGRITIQTSPDGRASVLLSK